MDAHKKVMFVDDEEGVRKSWNRYLSLAGFDVTTAADGAKAIVRLAEDPVDVVVADWKMPVLDGVELLEWIHDQQPDTRFILLTGYGNEELEQKVRDLGAFEYLNKPISPDALAAVVTAATILENSTTDVADETATMEAEEFELSKVAAESAAPEAAAREKGRVRTTVEVAGGLVIAPILGLAFVVFLPIVGFGALLWTLGRTIADAVRPART